MFLKFPKPTKIVIIQFIISLASLHVVKIWRQCEVLSHWLDARLIRIDPIWKCVENENGVGKEKHFDKWKLVSETRLSCNPEKIQVCFENKHVKNSRNETWKMENINQLFYEQRTTPPARGRPPIELKRLRHSSRWQRGSPWMSKVSTPTGFPSRGHAQPGDRLSPWSSISSLPDGITATT